MNSQTQLPNVQYPVIVRQEPSGQYTAEAVGLPEIRETCLDRAEAVNRVRLALCHWLASGQLVQVEIGYVNPLLVGLKKKDPNDPLEKEYLEELARYRQEDLERTLREYEQEEQACSNSSSTPIT